MSWKKQFDKLFPNSPINWSFIRIDVEQFITDLRKKDELELIKMLPEEIKEGGNLDDFLIGQVKQLIKDYYKE